MNKGNKRRRSSFGRRVSFSTATKVKEFATGDKDYTLWNSTYEEERKNVSSDSSHKSDTDSEVFLAEKTFMMNDEMEMTDVLPTVQPVDPGCATRTDMTVVGSEEMEVTMAANKTMEKFSVEDTNDQVTMEITALVKPASFFAKQLPCNSTKDDMEMTSAMTTAMLQNINDNRSRNATVKPQSVSSVTSFLSQLKSSSASANFEDDMEMTKPISMKETQEISIASEQNDDDMEITEFLTLPTKPAKNDSGNDDMEMTKPVCFKIDTKFKNEIISDEKVEKKELKYAKTTQTPPKSKVELDNDMEITKPISMKEIQEINITNMCAVNNEKDMEITEFLPREMLPEKTKKDCESENDDMEMTKPVCFQIESKDIANQFKEDTIVEEKEEKEKEMEDSPSRLTKLNLTQLSEETEQVSNSRRIAQDFLEVNESKDNASEISSVNVQDIKNVTTTPVNNEATERKLTTQNDEDVKVLELQNVKIQENGVKTVRDEERLNETNTETSLDQSETFDEMENSSSSFLGKTSPTKVNHEMSFDLKEAENRFNEEQKAWDVKLTSLRSHTDNIKRFLVDLDSRGGGGEKAENHEEPLPKRSKLMPSIFETLIPTKDRSHHGHWQIEHFDEKEAKFSFFQGTLELTLVLGHPSTKKDIKHWAVRRPSIMFMTMPMHNSIKLMHHLFLKEWTNERLSKVFESTVNICKSLELFGQSVNEAVRFVLNLDQIKGSHCLFKIEEFQVYVEHFSRPLHLAFAITVDFSQGFRVAKDQGTKLQPLVSSSSRGHMISDKTFGNICKNSPSGWNYITYLSTMLDKYIKEMEKDKK